MKLFFQKFNTYFEANCAAMGCAGGFSAFDIIFSVSSRSSVVFGTSRFFFCCISLSRAFICSREPSSNICSSSSTFLSCLGVGLAVHKINLRSATISSRIGVSSTSQKTPSILMLMQEQINFSTVSWNYVSSPCSGAS